MKKRSWARYAAISLLVGALSACDTPATHGQTTSLPLREGYRDPGDACRRVGEDSFTNQFLDDAADLIACPEGVAALSGFGPETGARAVANKDGWILISVPRH